MHPLASTTLVALFVVIPIAVGAALALGWSHCAGRGALRFAGAAVVFVWLLAWAGLASAGVLTRWEWRPPPAALALGVTLILTVVLACSRVGARFAQGLPLAALVGFHGFRLPLELAMHRAATEGTMPVQMSFSGANFDIVTGVTAIVVALLALQGRAPRWLLVAWLALSSALLLTIMGIALASTPLIAAFGLDRLNTWVGWFPFAWLPGFLVPAALFGEIVLARRLFQRDDGRPHDVSQ